MQHSSGDEITGPSISRLRSNSYDMAQTKRMRTGSISGRLRTASDLEESGLIDKHQKGLIKDLIISGDSTVQHYLDKYERGDRAEILELIKSGYLGRKQSVDLLDGLDFEFINGLRSGDEEDMLDGPMFDALGELPFDNLDRTASMDHTHHSQAQGHAQGQKTSNMPPPKNRDRMSSMDDMADILSRSRRGTLDALFLNESLFDDLPLPTNTATNHGGVGRTMSNDHAVFNEIYHQFASDKLRTGSVDVKGDVDLSAYAMHAANLQRGTSSGGTNNGLTLRLRESRGRNKDTSSANEAQATRSSNRLMTRHNRDTSTSDGESSAPHSLDNHVNTSTAASGNARRSDNIYSSHSHYTSHLYGTSLSNLTSHHNTHHSNTSGGVKGAFPSILQQETKDSTRKLPGYIGAYSPEQRRLRIEKFLDKRNRRVWSRKVKYDVRKNFADSRLRIKGRFVKKEDEDIMRELMNI